MTKLYTTITLLLALVLTIVAWPMIVETVIGRGFGGRTLGVFFLGPVFATLHVPGTIAAVAIARDTVTRAGARAASASSILGVLMSSWIVMLSPFWLVFIIPGALHAVWTISAFRAARSQTDA